MIKVRLSGGMGNQMFQYALGRKLSLQYDVPLILDISYLLNRTPRKGFTFRDYDLGYFCIDAKVHSRSLSVFDLLINKIKRTYFKGKGVEKSFQFDSSILSSGPQVHLQGHWQSYKYFKDIRETLQKDFALKNALSEKSELLHEEIKNSASVCVHVRRGDYVGNTVHDVSLGREYYAKGIEYVSSKHTIDSIYVFSDDIEWCKENLQFDKKTVFVGSEYSGNKGEGHITLMKACKHFVIANSSFSWWPAWLATNPQKVVIAPAQWFADTSIVTADLIPEDWIRL